MTKNKPTSDEQPQVVWHGQTVTRAMREAQKKQQGCVVWFTGLSGCGKSTLANLVEQMLCQHGFHTYLLDGDNLRHGLNATPQLLAEEHNQAFGERFGLGFQAEDRVENIRRVGAVSQLFCDAGLITLAAFVSPYQADREAVRKKLAAGDFIEVFVDTPLEVCESRDPKGLYKKARAGEIKNFTGIDAPYETPVAAEIHLIVKDKSAKSLAEEVFEYLKKSGKLGACSHF